MSYTAIVLTPESVAKLREAAGAIPHGWIERMHHVTLCLGEKAKFERLIGNTRTMTVWQRGQIEGRVWAFAVLDAEDSESQTPHVTIAHAPEAKPRESNDIGEWTRLRLRECFEIEGIVQICD